jgi:NAD dependent epimerase/dehydratase family enzyme
MGLGSALGSGKQWMPWIHVDDVAAAFVYAGNTESMDGVYNAVSPHPATNRDFSAALARALNRPFWFPAPPAWALRLALGERSILLLGSTPASAKKIQEAGFAFCCTELDAALQRIFR